MSGGSESSEAVKFNLTIDRDGGATLVVTAHDGRLQERLFLLRDRGATREGDSWVLEVENVENITELQAHLVGMVADVVAPKPLTAADRETVFERDGNRCRMCMKDFDQPHIADSDARSDTRIIDHIYPNADAEDVHSPNEPLNLATVCGGCDDVALQGDSLRFVPGHIKKVLDRIDRQILAWLQKRPLARTDWLVHQLNAERAADQQLSVSLVEDRLLAFTRMGLLQHEADIAPEEAFDVYRVDFHANSVVFKDTNAVHRHRHHLPPLKFVENLEGENIIEMDERISPMLPGVGTGFGR